MRALLGIGTNLGDREGNLAEAFSGLEKLPGTKILAISNIYETGPGPWTSTCWYMRAPGAIRRS